MKVLIVEDEAPARDRLAALLRDCSDLVVVGAATNGQQALEMINRLEPDVVLLDISMPLMDGLEAAKEIRKLERAPALIFCTAYEEHALAAFEAHAVDYLVKPVRFERLREALDRAKKFIGLPQYSSDEEKIQTQAKKRTHICARVRGSLVLVPIGDIHYLLAEDKYIVVHHAKGEVLIEESLKALEQEFADQFVRIHRNCLVALNRLAGLSRANDGRILVRLTGVDMPLEVSRRNLPSLRKLVREL